LNPIDIEKQLLFYALDMLSAINTIHQHNIIHCDIKPQNFLLFNSKFSSDDELESFDKLDNSYHSDSSVSSFDENDILKLTDFGLCHFIEDDKEKAYMERRSGTQQYMAPELTNVNNYKNNIIIIILF
jgi:serine/threonine protein kinase